MGGATGCGDVQNGDVSVHVRRMVPICRFFCQGWHREVAADGGWGGNPGWVKSRVPCICRAHQLFARIHPPHRHTSFSRSAPQNGPTSVAAPAASLHVRGTAARAAPLMQASTRLCLLVTRQTAACRHQCRQRRVHRCRRRNRQCRCCRCTPTAMCCCQGPLVHGMWSRAAAAVAAAAAPRVMAARVVMEGAGVAAGAMWRMWCFRA